MPRTVAVVALVAFVGCGRERPSIDDAAVVFDAHVVDAPEPEPLPIAPVLWERLVSAGDTEGPPGVEQMAWLSTGAAIVGWPNIAVYDAFGERIGSAPRPFSSTGGTVKAAVGRLDGSLAVLYEGPSDTLRVFEYGGSPFAEIRSTYVRDASVAALVEKDGTFYAFTYQSGAHEIHAVTDGVVTTTALAIPVGQHYIPRGEGAVAPDGRLFFCVVHEEAQLPKLLAIDPETAAWTEMTLSETPGAGNGSCRLSAGPRSLLAMWGEPYPAERRWTVISPDGASILAGPSPGGTMPGAVSSVVHDGSQFVAIANTGSSTIILYTIDELTGELGQAWSVRMQPGEELFTLGWDGTSDGSNLYVALAPAYQLAPRQLRLQKLASLQGGLDAVFPSGTP